MKVAVVGSGIAGLSAAHFLDHVHDVQLIEADHRLGGHSHTHSVPQNEGPPLSVDSGFLVHNGENYPLLCRLFDRLGISTIETDMSFGVSCSRCDLEYSGVGAWRQPRVLLHPPALRLMSEITRFLLTAARRVRDGQTLRAFCDAGGYSAAFRRHFLVPLIAALWSTGSASAEDFPAAFAVRFFSQHGMLGVRRHRWRTVEGGSHRYVSRLAGRLHNPPRLGVPVRSVTRHSDHVAVRFDDDRVQRFDAVVLATHADTSRAILQEDGGAEYRALAPFRVTVNEAYLHTDRTHLPARSSAQASWNYRIDDCRSPVQAVTVTYNVSRLQRLAGDRRYLVTLNPTRPIHPEHTVARMSYSHPQYDLHTPAAQAHLRTVNGADRIWVCGAWTRYGFHEDGIRSAFETATRLGGGW